MLDVHGYDGTVGDLWRAAGPPAPAISMDDAVAFARERVSADLSGARLVAALRSIALFESDAGNADGKNALDARDVFRAATEAVIAARLGPEDVFYSEQLAEIIGGSCPQGRTTRMWQVYASLNTSTPDTGEGGLVGSGRGTEESSMMSAGDPAIT